MKKVKVSREEYLNLLTMFLVTIISSFQSGDYLIQGNKEQLEAAGF